MGLTLYMAYRFIMFEIKFLPWITLPHYVLFDHRFNYLM
jgi:hypothetical protein